MARLTGSPRHPLTLPPISLREEPERLLQPRRVQTKQYGKTMLRREKI
jgi:hypothetical protein